MKEQDTHEYVSLGNSFGMSIAFQNAATIRF